MKFTGELSHDEIVQAIHEFVRRNHPNHSIETRELRVDRDSDGRLRAVFTFDLEATKAAFGGKSACSSCGEAGHNVATCWKSAKPQ